MIAPTKLAPDGTPSGEHLTCPGWMPEPALWTVEQAAVYLSVSPRTVKRLLASGQLVKRRIGASVRIPRTSLEAFLKRDHPTQSNAR